MRLTAKDTFQGTENKVRLHDGREVPTGVAQFGYRLGSCETESHFWRIVFQYIFCGSHVANNIITYDLKSKHRQYFVVYTNIKEAIELILIHVRSVIRVKKQESTDVEALTRQKSASPHR